MRINELISENCSQVDEGWKDTLGNLAIAGAIGAGGAGGMAVKGAFDTNTPQTGTPPQQLAQQLAQPPERTNPAVHLKKSAKQVAKQVVVNPITNNNLEHLLMSVAKRAGLAGAELAAFMAQCAHESADFSSLSEIGKKSNFKKYDPKFSPKLAKILGNMLSGDGERYKGRGFIQLTGRWNYKIAGQALGLPLEENPMLAARPEIAAKIAVWFWKNRVQPNVDNFHNVTSVTKFINPGLHGLASRKENFNAYLASAS